MLARMVRRVVVISVCPALETPGHVTVHLATNYTQMKAPVSMVGFTSMLL